jgi:hypothetical protein
MTVNIGIELDPRVELKARRTLAGDIMIMDHEDIDIVLMLEKGKCMTFPKTTMSDRVYSAQERMFTHLAKRGLIQRSDIQGANVFGALEAKMMDSNIPGIDRDQAFLYSLNEYINEEKPYFDTADEYDDERLDSLLHPGDDTSTELGDVPHSDRKGSHDSRVRPYGFMYNYSLVREGQGED